MCECLEFDDGSMHLCAACAPCHQKQMEVGDALGEWVLQFSRLLLEARERGTDVAVIEENFNTFVKHVTDDIFELTEDDWECIFDVNVPVPEWKMHENQDLLEEANRDRLKSQPPEAPDPVQDQRDG